MYFTGCCLILAVTHLMEKYANYWHGDIMCSMFEKNWSKIWEVSKGVHSKYSDFCTSWVACMLCQLYLDDFSTSCITCYTVFDDVSPSLRTVNTTWVNQSSTHLPSSSRFNWLLCKYHVVESWGAHHPSGLCLSTRASLPQYGTLILLLLKAPVS